ncbi:LLM class flavin-dependent oxidoreductase [Microbacterium sp. X-17]|uniref:LLM class flavin-dependent oxidoreductase n=1 Tax=Microbacterium sp. X-17 TaxID=3144404 RepID=UPI0031F4A121
MTASPLALSVLDLVPVRARQTSAQAIAASLDLVRHAERLGIHRYWYAEHHNMPAVASTAPPVLIAAAASVTRMMRVGSGGVMLPNHSPLIVAEQFAALEALAPGRIDLGIGRAPGSDPVISQLLRQSGTTSEVDRFPDNVRDIIALTSPEGASVRVRSLDPEGSVYEIHATPASDASPDVWLLGSSDYSAQLAATLGLPYVFANHFAGRGLGRALDLYREQYRPSAAHPQPRTFLTANALAAPTAEEAEERALPQLRAMVRLRTNQPLRPQETVEDAVAAERGAQPLAGALMDEMRARWFVGTGADVAAGLRELAARFDLDEVMISPIGGAYAGEPLDASPDRVRTLELLTAALA